MLCAQHCPMRVLIAISLCIAGAVIDAAEFNGVHNVMAWREIQRCAASANEEIDFWVTRASPKSR